MGFTLVGLSVLILFSFYSIKRIQWRRNLAARNEQLLTSSIEKDAPLVQLSQEKAPPIVMKYFQRVLRDGQPIITRATIHQTGGFRENEAKEDWSKMVAQQVFTCHHRGFIWNSQITSLLGMKVNVLDSYIQGKGEMKAALLGAIKVVNEGDKPELNQGALQRYLAESVWFPTALLPSQGVTWRSLGDLKAEASITDHHTTARLEFHFNAKGEVIEIYSPGRYREVDGQYQLTPWGGKLSNYQEVAGYKIPFTGVVAWYLGDQTYTYWKADLTQVTMN